VGEVCHFVDLLQHLAGSPPDKVFASRISAPEPVVMNDNVFVTLDFRDGSRGMILYTSLGGPSAPKEMLDIYADGAVLTIHNFRTCRIYRGTAARGRRNRRQDKGHNREFEELVRAVSLGEPAPIPLEEQAAATLATFKILESLEKQAPVAVDPGEIFKSPGPLPE
jgi:polar amino acid transport system substrate-binding protein